VTKSLPKTIILLGPPGSGKDTQAFALARKFGHFVLVTGDLFRAKAEEATDVGRRLASFMSRGELVPSDLATLSVAEELERHQGTLRANGLLLNGYPRNGQEAEDCERLLTTYNLRPEVAVLLDVSDEEVRARLAARGRPDDAPEVVEHRLAVYREETSPVIEHYRKKGKLLTVDGNPSVRQVTKTLIAVLTPSQV